MRSAVLVLSASFACFADPISVVILNQTTQTAVSTSGGCSNVDPLSATCSTSEPPLVPGTDAGTQFATSSIVTTQLYARSAASGFGAGEAFASIIETVLITGGTGTGYLNLVFQGNGDGPSAGYAYISVADQSIGNSTNQISPIWGVLPFQFGQPFTYAMSLNATADSIDGQNWGSLNFLGARLYSSTPSGCGLFNPNAFFGFCNDPNFVTADLMGAPVSSQTIPEPNTIWMLGTALLVPGARRMLSRRGA